MEEYQYEPNDLESDQFLSEIPVSLMKENIKAQFENPMEYRKKDHVTSFINMYYYSTGCVNGEAEDMDEVVDSLTELRDDFYSFMQEIFRKYLGIGFNNFDEKSKADQDRMIHYTYRFFICNIKKNFVCLIMNLIEKNKDDYIGDDDKKKDVTSLALKKDGINPEDIYTIANLYDLTQSVLSEDIDVDEFLDNCDDDELFLETRFMKAMFDDFQITGNFVEKYINMISKDFLSEIECKIRNKVLSKYIKDKDAQEE